MGLLFFHHRNNSKPSWLVIVGMRRNIPGLRYAPHDTKSLRRFSTGARSFSLGSERLSSPQTGRRKSCNNPKSQCEISGTFFHLFLTALSFCLHAAHAFLPRYRCIHSVSKTSVDQRGLKNPSQNIYSHLVPLMGFLFYLERIQHPIKPKEPTPALSGHIITHK